MKKNSIQLISIFILAFIFSKYIIILISNNLPSNIKIFDLAFTLNDLQTRLKLSLVLTLIFSFNLLSLQFFSKRILKRSSVNIFILSMLGIIISFFCAILKSEINLNFGQGNYNILMSVYLDHIYKQLFYFSVIYLILISSIFKLIAKKDGR